jgi:PqqD family protein of HPr-rel-A system
MSIVWRVKSEPAVLWRCWDGEYVAYCEATGNTHHLEGLAAEIFDRLLTVPASREALCERVTEAFDSDAAARLQAAVPMVIETLATAELIEPLPS